MKIVFFGTPDYVIPILDKLHKSFKSKSGNSPIAAVVTQPPKPVGRKQILNYSPVDDWAYKRKVPIFFEPSEIINKNIKADIGIVASYGRLIPANLIRFFPKGILVIHPSLLPQFRWGSPVPAAIITNTNPSGVTIIKMDDKFDHGPIVSQFKEEVSDEDTSESLRARLFQRSADVLTTLLPAYIEGKITLREQKHSKATFARIITKEDGFIPSQYLKSAIKGSNLKDKWKINFIKSLKIQISAESVDRFIRAMYPWPVAWSIIRIKNQKSRIKIIKAHLEEFSNNKSLVASQKLVVDEVQLEGKDKVSWKQFIEGYPDATFE